MKKLLIMILMIIIATGCKQKEVTVNDAREKGIPVTVAEVRKSSGENSLNYSGSIEASQTIPLFFQTTGTVEKVIVETGDAVKKGQLLATLDQTDLKNISAMTEVKYKQAKDAYERMKKVYEQGSLPEIRWVEMETDLEQARSSMELAKNSLDKCFLRSPADGIIGKRNIEPGMIPLNLGSAPFELVDINMINVKISVPENEINKINKGMKANISVLAINGTRYEGIVTNISPVAELMSRTYTVKITVGNPRHELKPGMVCDVTIPSGKGTAALVVPYPSVSKDNDGNNFVFVVNPDKSSVKKQIVITGRYIGTGIEITGGLAEGELIVVKGIEKLSDNSLIKM